MTRENVQASLHNICANYAENCVCRFVETENALGSIDTSQGQNGSRGIVFFGGAAILNFDGTPRAVRYCDIENIRVIDSFEDAFTDELLISFSGGEVRISDFSLNKHELKKLLDELIADDKKVREQREYTEKFAEDISRNLAEKTAEENAQGEFISDDKKAREQREYTEKFAEDISRNLAEKAAEENAQNGLADDEQKSHEQREYTEKFAEDISRNLAEKAAEENALDDIPVEEGAPFISETVIPENYKPDPIPEDKINWLSGEMKSENSRQAVVEEPPETPRFSGFEVVEKQEKAADNEPYNTPNTSETEDRVNIQNMSREETLSFLAQSLSEINAPAAREETPELPAEQPIKTISDYAAVPEEETQKSGLTVEPIWGDIYIKASRNLRELCESGKLTMEQIETELTDKLLDSARAFAQVTAKNSKVPKVLIPKITELKSAAYNFDRYFQSGEDIAVRAMFFMLYQMLSYADRIAETPETKERLNDFFRRFGPAGITLSMLDMRV